MLATESKSVILLGLEAIKVGVEVDVAGGLPSITVVGLLCS